MNPHGCVCSQLSRCWCATRSKFAASGLSRDSRWRAPGSAYGFLRGAWPFRVGRGSLVYGASGGGELLRDDLSGLQAVYFALPLP